MVCPSSNIGLFAGVGYAFSGMGVNAGAKIRFAPTKKCSPFLLAMYGYNAAIAITNASQYNKTFYGGTIGIGLDCRSSFQRKGYWSFALLVPFRGSEVSDYIDDLKNNHGVEFKNNLLPIALSIGYRFVIK